MENDLTAYEEASLRALRFRGLVYSTCMDDKARDWIESILQAVEVVAGTLRDARANKDRNKIQQAKKELMILQNPLNEIGSKLFDNWHSGLLSDYTGYTYVMQKVQLIRSHLKHAEDIARYLDNPGPTYRSTDLYPKVWDAARSLWEVGHYEDAVSSAARIVNAMIQNKIDRRDISDRDLCAQTFSMNPPKQSAARLRFPGDRTTQDWANRQSGALLMSQGAYVAIRNPLAHREGNDLDEREAFEMLATFSLLARWVDECDVDTCEQE